MFSIEAIPCLTALPLQAQLGLLFLFCFSTVSRINRTQALTGPNSFFLPRTSLRTCRRMEKFCGRFSLAGKEEIRSKTHNMRLYSAKMCTTNLTQTVCLRLCGELFCFSGLTRSFSWTHGSGACPAPASSTAFSGQRPGPAGTAPCGCWPCPRLKNGGIQSHSSADQRRLPPE